MPVFCSIIIYFSWTVLVNFIFLLIYLLFIIISFFFNFPFTHFQIESCFQIHYTVTHVVLQYLSLTNLLLSFSFSSLSRILSSSKDLKLTYNPSKIYFSYSLTDSFSLASSFSSLKYCTSWSGHTVLELHCAWATLPPPCLLLSFFLSLSLSLLSCRGITFRAETHFSAGRTEIRRKGRYNPE